MNSVMAKKRPTPRTPDNRDSAARFASGGFLRLSLFLTGRLRRPRPSAGQHKPLGVYIRNIKALSRVSLWLLVFPQK